jgi:hypothetical protein
MTIPELCDQIIAKRQAEVAVADAATEPSLEEPFPEALEDGFLADNIEAMNDVLQNLSKQTEASLLGTAEINSFLAAFLKAHDVQRRPRLQKWADIYSTKKAQAAPEGALQLQLKALGLKENEYLENVLKIGK